MNSQPNFAGAIFGMMMAGVLTLLLMVVVNAVLGLSFTIHYLVAILGAMLYGGFVGLKAGDKK
jgi:FtsH-binding integral membrane protein